MNQPYKSTTHIAPVTSSQKRYREKREWYIERNRERKRLFREYYMENKDKPCTDCGVQYDPICMEYDHRDPSTKLFNVSQPQNVSSMKKLVEEIDKCDVVCANCHKIRTWRKKP
jgi:hypothetical protein